MPSNEQRRQAAKRKLERQLARRAERARRRRVWGVVITVAVVVAGVALVYWLVNVGGSDEPAAADTSTSAPPEPVSSKGPCTYTESPEETKDPPPGLPDDPDPTPKKGTVQVSLQTSQGTIPLTLDRAKAPCTVQSMEHLVKQKFFDSTQCHRLTTTDGLQVLQCGDPTGSGSGGPGYTIPDEPPTGLKKAPKDNPAGPEGVIYPRGTLAMANTGQPNSGGSQFFIVYKATYLPPNYAVFGTVDEAGLKVVDTIAKAGVKAGGRSETDGAPKLDVTIKSAKVS